MKTTAKVFIWIGMIIQFYLIFPIIVGIFALRKIDEASSKEDLQTMGIITTFFCSLLGGIFMLSIKDQELGLPNDNKNLYSKEKVLDENPKDELAIKENNHKNMIASFISLISIGLLLFVSLIFSLIGIIGYQASLPLILNVMLIAIYVFIFINFYKHEKKFTKNSYILLGIFYLLSIAQIVLSVLSVEEISNGNYCWTGWVNFGLTVGITIIIAFAIVFNIVIQLLKKKKHYVIVVKNNMESELKEIKRLLDDKTISEEEYNRMRSSVISKYYK